MTIDLDAIRARVGAAAPGPWLDGDPWRVAGVGFHHRGPDECAYCHLGPPVWVGKRDINGEIMQAHRHRSSDPYAPGHVITSIDGGAVAGNYGYEAGGIVDSADQAFIRHAREDIPALLAEVEKLRSYCADLERDVLAVIDERDRYQEVADDLAHAIAVTTGVDIGEHSSMNDPWHNALEAIGATAAATR